MKGKKTMAYVIRTMSTTDARPGQKIEQYHVYLLKVEKRAGAYWRRDTVDAIRFDSTEAALEHGRLSLRDDNFDVVPLGDDTVPTFWDSRRADYRSRVIGTEIVVDEAKPSRASLGI